MPQEESVRLNINERYATVEDNQQMKRRNMRLMGAALVLSVIAVGAVVTLTAQAGQRTELAEDVAKRLGYSLARKPRQFTMLDEGEPIVAPVRPSRLLPVPTLPPAALLARPTRSRARSLT